MMRRIPRKRPSRAPDICCSPNDGIAATRSGAGHAAQKYCALGAPGLTPRVLWEESGPGLAATLATAPLGAVGRFWAIILSGGMTISKQPPYTEARLAPIFIPR